MASIRNKPGSAIITERYTLNDNVWAITYQYDKNWTYSYITKWGKKGGKTQQSTKVKKASCIGVIANIITKKQQKGYRFNSMKRKLQFD